MLIYHTSRQSNSTYSDETQICAACGEPFTRARASRRVTCSNSCQVRLGWANMSSEGRKKRIETASRVQTAIGAGGRLNDMRWSRPGAREEASIANRNRWADPEYKARVGAAISRGQSTPEARAKLSAAARRRWADPDYRARCLTAVRLTHRTDRYRQLMSELRRKQWKEPEKRARWVAALRHRAPKQSAFMKARWYESRLTAARAEQAQSRPQSSQAPRGYSMIGSTLRLTRNSPWRRLDTVL